MFCVVTDTVTVEGQPVMWLLHTVLWLGPFARVTAMCSCGVHLGLAPLHVAEMDIRVYEIVHACASCFSAVIAPGT